MENFNVDCYTLTGGTEQESRLAQLVPRICQLEMGAKFRDGKELIVVISFKISKDQILIPKGQGCKAEVCDPQDALQDHHVPESLGKLNATHFGQGASLADFVI